MADDPSKSRTARRAAIGGSAARPGRPRVGVCSAGSCCCWRWPGVFFSGGPADTISYSEFKALVREGKVQEVTVGET